MSATDPLSPARQQPARRREQPQEQPDLAARIAKALAFAPGIVHAGDHHKAWVVDQMVRALTGCPPVTGTAVDANGRPYSFEEQGESGDYQRFVAEFDAKWGAGTWQEGAAP